MGSNVTQPRWWHRQSATPTAKDLCMEPDNYEARMSPQNYMGQGKGSATPVTNILLWIRIGKVYLQKNNVNGNHSLMR